MLQRWKQFRVALFGAFDIGRMDAAVFELNVPAAALAETRQCLTDNPAAYARFVGESIARAEISGVKKKLI